LNIGGLINHILPQSSTQVLVLINVGSMGVANLPEVRTAEDINHTAAVEAIKSSPEIIGIKVRMVTPGITALGIELPKAAKAIADEADGLTMAHIGDIAGQNPAAPKLTIQLLTEILTDGDIVTHTLSGEVGALLAGGSLIAEAQEARRNGVYFDVGVGGGNFSFESARKIIDQGFIPDTISSDITAASRFDGPVFSLTECMGKMMALGIAFEDTICMTTAKPAEILGMQDEIGSLSVGTGADISILDLVDGKFTFHERTGPGAVGTQAILPVLAVRAGKSMPIDYGPRPWGWLPIQKV
jgi:dihydroorotase